MHASLNTTQITYDKSSILQLTLQEDPELKPLFERAKSGHPTDLMKMLTDPALTQKVMAKLNGAPGPAASGEEPEINNLWDMPDIKTAANTILCCFVFFCAP